MKTMQELRKQRSYINVICLVHSNFEFFMDMADKDFKELYWARYLIVEDSYKVNKYLSAYPMAACQVYSICKQHRRKLRKETYVLQRADATTSTCHTRETVATWEPFNGQYTLHSSNLKLTDIKNFKGRTLKVGCVHVFPFFMLDVKEGKVEGTGGIEFHLLKTMAQYLNFKFELVTPADRHWGSKMSNGTWTGMIGLVHRKEADFAMSEISRTFEREEAVEYTDPHMLDPVLFLTRSPGEKPRAFVILRPFTVQIWLLIAAAVLVCTTFLYGLSQVAITINKTRVQIGQLGWYLYGSLLMQAPNVYILKRDSFRLMVAFWWMFALIVISAYSGTLTSFMNVPGMNEAVDTVEKLEASVVRENMKAGTVIGTSFLTNFLVATEGTFLELGKRMKENPKETTAENLNQGMRWTLERNFAFIFALAPLEAKAAGLGWERFIIAKDQFFTTVYAIPIQQGCPYKNTFNKILRKIQEAGLILKWKQDLLVKLRVQAAKSDEVESGGPRSLGLEDLQGAFYLLSLGLVFSILVLAGENCYIRKRGIMMN
ncbi:glutamate receptor ionotropic, delta-2-like [Tachypleus tridentatus]|uniref:glutamate receptor ionotropic, delta-2-like n=1 Tax=Tachypleus tridentatus TaxID=6853 RepID=UPI003FD0D487